MEEETSIVFNDFYESEVIVVEEVTAEQQEYHQTGSHESFVLPDDGCSQEDDETTTFEYNTDLISYSQVNDTTKNISYDYHNQQSVIDIGQNIVIKNECEDENNGENGNDDDTSSSTITTYTLTGGDVQIISNELPLIQTDEVQEFTEIYQGGSFENKFEGNGVGTTVFLDQHGNFQPFRIVAGKAVSKLNGNRQSNSDAIKKTYKCNVCSATFDRSYHLKRHNFIGVHQQVAANKPVVRLNGIAIKTTTPQRPPPKPSTTPNTSSPPSNVTVHNNLMYKEKWYKINDVTIGDSVYHICSFCNEIFADLIGLDEHLQNHNLVTFEHKCELCDRFFQNRQFLKNHVHGHCAIRNHHRCTICERTFYTPQMLANHRSHHTLSEREEIPVTCKQCSQSFLNHNLLLSHQYLHNNEKPFKCQLCASQFIHLTILVKHKKSDLMCKNIQAIQGLNS